MKYIFKLLFFFLWVLAYPASYLLTVIVNFITFIWYLNSKYFIDFNWVDFNYYLDNECFDIKNSDKRQVCFYKNPYHYLKGKKTKRVIRRSLDPDLN